MSRYNHPAPAFAAQLITKLDAVLALPTKEGRGYVINSEGDIAVTDVSQDTLVDKGNSVPPSELPNLPGVPFVPDAIGSVTPAFEAVLRSRPFDSWDALAALVSVHDELDYMDTVAVIKGLYVMLADYVSEAAGDAARVASSLSLENVDPQRLAAQHYHSFAPSRRFQGI